MNSPALDVDNATQDSLFVSHCWHSSPMQHSMVNHRDVLCCFCGKCECRNGDQVRDTLHGEFCPEKKVIFRSPVVEECPKRVESTIS